VQMTFRMQSLYCTLHETNKAVLLVKNLTKATQAPLISLVQLIEVGVSIDTIPKLLTYIDFGHITPAYD
jgi:hypothetical protein